MRGSNLGRSITSRTSNNSVKKKVYLKYYFFDVVAIGPIFEQALHQGNSKAPILGKEEHAAAHQLLMEKMTGLHLMEGNNDRIEKGHVFFSQRDGKSGNDTRFRKSKKYLAKMSKSSAAPLNL